LLTGARGLGGLRLLLLLLLLPWRRLVRGAAAASGAVGCAASTGVARLLLRLRRRPQLTLRLRHPRSLLCVPLLSAIACMLGLRAHTCSRHNTTQQRADLLQVMASMHQTTQAFERPARLRR
jgi:hypothetical protein